LRENVFLFGLTAQQVAGSRGWYDPRFTSGDYYMQLADLRSYLDADRRMTELYARTETCAHTAMVNVAGPGKFSSDRSIHGYTTDIWHAQACPIR
jgi:glycogen phosphorylase